MAFCKALSAGPLGPTAAAGLQMSQYGEGDIRATLTQQGHLDTALYLMQNEAIVASLSPTQLELLSQAASSGSLARFVRSSQVFSHDLKVYMTQNGFIGLGPKVMSEGDEVCVLFGGRVPFILRRMHDHHIFIGETYIHDDKIMWGKLTEGVRFRNEIPTTTFEIR